MPGLYFGTATHNHCGSGYYYQGKSKNSTLINIIFIHTTFTTNSGHSQKCSTFSSIMHLLRTVKFRKGRVGGHIKLCEGFVVTFFLKKMIQDNSCDTVHFHYFEAHKQAKMK